MVTEPDSITSEKRISFLHKEQIIDKNSMIQMNLGTYASMITLKQNLDIPVSEMMKQLVEVTKIIYQNRIQECTLEEISYSNVLSRDRRHCGNNSRFDKRDKKHRERNGWESDDDRRSDFGQRWIVEWKRMWCECSWSNRFSQGLMSCPSVFYVSPVCSVCWNAALDWVEHCRLSLRSLRKGCLTAISENRITMKLWVPWKIDWELENRVAESWKTGKWALQERRCSIREDEGFDHALDHQIESGGELHLWIQRRNVRDRREAGERWNWQHEQFHDVHFTRGDRWSRFVSVMLTLDESRNMETDRAKLWDTLEGMHDPKGINIHEDT